MPGLVGESTARAAIDMFVKHQRDVVHAERAGAAKGRADAVELANLGSRGQPRAAAGAGIHGVVSRANSWTSPLYRTDTATRRIVD